MFRILIVEDDERLRDVFTEFLTESGYEVRVADNGKLAWQLLEKQRFDLVITDLVMPEMEGIELITMLRKAGHDVPIIAMTGGGKDKSIYLTLAGKLGANEILMKPFSLGQLSSAVSSALSIARE